MVGVASSKYENIAAFPVTKSRATNVEVEIVKGKYVLPPLSFLLSPFSFLLSLITSTETIAKFELRLTEFSLQARANSYVLDIVPNNFGLQGGHLDELKWLNDQYIICTGDFRVSN